MAELHLASCSHALIFARHTDDVIAALDLSGSQDELLARIDELADRVRALRNAARGTRHAA